MTAQWFTRARLDLGGVSTETIAQQALDCLAGIGVAAPGDDEAASMRGRGIDGARYALDHLLADPAFCVVAQAAGFEPDGLRGEFDACRFDAVATDLRIIMSVGRTANLPEAEKMVRETIDAQANFIASFGRDFFPIQNEGA